MQKATRARDGVRVYARPHRTRETSLFWQRQDWRQKQRVDGRDCERLVMVMDMEYHGRSSASRRRPASGRQRRAANAYRLESCTVWQCHRSDQAVEAPVTAWGSICLSLRSGLRHLHLLDLHLSPTPAAAEPFTLSHTTHLVASRTRCSLPRRLSPLSSRAAASSLLAEHPSLTQGSLTTLPNHCFHHRLYTFSTPSLHRHHAPLVQHQQHQLVQLGSRGDDADLRQDRVRQQQ